VGIGISWKECSLVTIEKERKERIPGGLPRGEEKMRSPKGLGKKGTSRRESDASSTEEEELEGEDMCRPGGTGSDVGSQSRGKRKLNLIGGGGG